MCVLLMFVFVALFFFFFFNDTATTEIYTLSLHDALPISGSRTSWDRSVHSPRTFSRRPPRSEEHTSELQSHLNLVCRLLLEKKKNSRPLGLFFDPCMLGILASGRQLH